MPPAALSDDFDFHDIQMHVNSNRRVSFMARIKKYLYLSRLSVTVCLSVWLAGWLSVCLSVGLWIDRSIHPSIHPSIFNLCSLSLSLSLRVHSYISRINVCTYAHIMNYTLKLMTRQLGLSERWAPCGSSFWTRCSSGPVAEEQGRGEFRAGQVQLPRGRGL